MTQNPDTSTAEARFAGKLFAAEPVVVRAAADGGPWTIFRTGDEGPARSLGPIRATGRFWSKYAVFTGRASRSEFWWAWLFTTVVYAVILIGVPRVFGDSPDYTLSTGYLGPAFSSGWDLATATGSGLDDSASAVAVLVRILLTAFTIVTFVPTLALSFRRLHDVNLPGVLGLLGLGGTPLTGVLLIVALIGSRPSGVRFDRPVVRIDEDRGHSRLPTRSRLVTVLIVVAVAAAAVVISTVGLGSVPSAAQGEWRLQSFSDGTGQPGRPARLPAQPITLSVRGDSLRGNDSCNDFSAHLARIDPWLTSASRVGTTSCSDDDAARRARFHAAFAAVTSASTDGQTLTLTGPRDVLLTFVRD